MISSHLLDFPLICWCLGIAPLLIRRWDCGRMLDEALEANHVSRKEAAAAMGWQPPQLSSAISGQGREHLSLDRMTNLPDLVWMELIVAIGVQLGLMDPPAKRTERLARVTCRMVKARLRRERGERQYA